MIDHSLTRTEPEVRTCACGAPVHMRRNARTGQINPITTDPVADGNLALNDDGSYRLIGKTEAYDGPRYASHHAVCGLNSLRGRRDV